MIPYDFKHLHSLKIAQSVTYKAILSTFLIKMHFHLVTKIVIRKIFSHQDVPGYIHLYISDTEQFFNNAKCLKSTGNI